MKAAKGGSWTGGILLCSGIIAFLAYTSSAPAQTKTQYKKEECVQCHAARVSEIATAGGKHRSVPCVGCHVGHPPDVKKPIALCSKCHFKTRKAHFELTGCLNCHTNPHTPMRISFKGKDACLNCHAVQADQLRNNRSKHSLVDCSECHDVHRKVPECTKCHVPHSGKITGGCKQCHKAHMPKLVTYSADIPSKDCGACHKKVADLFVTNTSKHKPLECAFCHKEKHRMVPACQDCHGSPHPAGIMAKFQKCGRCHNIAHDLNNWTVVGSAVVGSEVTSTVTSTAPKPPAASTQTPTAPKPRVTSSQTLTTSKP
jgi:hypothetical protein